MTGVAGEDSIVSIQYFDGLGRPVQTVARGITPDNKDLVNYLTYDALGREEKAYLPLKGNSNTGDFVNFNAFSTLSKTIYQDDAKPYAQTVYEASPLNRVIAQYGAGFAWNPNVNGTGGKPVKTEYLPNSASDCGYYYVLGNDILRSGNYQANQLYVTKVTDEDGNVAFEFKDKLGRVILTRQIDGSEQINTYYVYDDFGNLRFVLPPMAADGFTSGKKTTKDPLLRKYAYMYKYDYRNRCIYKSIPGCEPIYYIYDKSDRLIFTQDGEMRATSQNKWLMTIPDKLGRNCLSFFISKALDYTLNPYSISVITARRTNADNLLFGYVIDGLQAGDNIVMQNLAVLTVNYYDDYTFLGTNGISVLKYGYEDAGTDYGAAYEPAGQEAYCHKGLLTGTITAYNKTFIEQTIEDNLDIINVGDPQSLEIDPAEREVELSGITPDFSSSDENGNNDIIINKDINKLLDKMPVVNPDVTGMGGCGYLATVMYYDQRGQIVQSKSNNHLGGMEKEYISYNFTGQPVKRKLTHTQETYAPTEIAEVYTYTYDHAGRLLKTYHQLNNATAQTILADNMYDDLGRLKTLNNKGGVRKTDYTYNVRSWVTGITNPVFTETLSYTFGGNISTQQWQQPESAEGALKSREYNFTYDGLERLTKATDNSQVFGVNYSTSYSYDKHGNITSLKRMGVMNNKIFEPIDDLTLTYNGNQLLKVTENASDNMTIGFADFKDLANEDTEYFYNANGAMTKDMNKGIDNVKYNALSLPIKVQISTPELAGTNEYFYTSTGTKLHVTHQWEEFVAGTNTGVSETSTTDYVGNKIYENGKLSKILVDNGYIKIDDGKYYFYVKDHLGNNRVVQNQSGVAIQSTQFYLYGMPYQDRGFGQEQQPYLFGSKELDLVSGLNWYDFSARHYDDVLGRFTTPDPMAERYYRMSPYCAFGGNPLRYVDPTGMVLTDYVDIETGAITHIEDGKDQVIASTSDLTNTMQDYFDTDRDIYDFALGVLENSALNMNMTQSQFMFLAETMYAESAGGFEESLGIFNVLENRAANQGNSIFDQLSAKSPYGVYGVWKTSGGKNSTYKYSYQNETGNAANTKRANIHRAIAVGRITDIDVTNGAYFWDGTDYKNTPRYTQGTLFTDPSHNLWNLESHKVNDKYMFQTTNAIGKTTFSKFYNQGKLWYMSK